MRCHGGSGQTSYTVARSVYDGNLAAETSAATLTLFLVGLWALATIARPYTWWRILPVLAMAVAFAAVLVIPFLQEFSQLQLVGTTTPWAAIGLATAADLLLEAIWICTRSAAPPGRPPDRPRPRPLPQPRHDGATTGKSRSLGTAIGPRSHPAVTSMAQPGRGTWG